MKIYKIAQHNIDITHDIYSLSQEISNNVMSNFQQVVNTVQRENVYIYKTLKINNKVLDIIFLWQENGLHNDKYAFYGKIDNKELICINIYKINMQFNNSENMKRRLKNGLSMILMHELDHAFNDDIKGSQSEIGTNKYFEYEEEMRAFLNAEIYFGIQTLYEKGYGRDQIFNAIQNNELGFSSPRYKYIMLQPHLVNRVMEYVDNILNNLSF